MKGGATKGLSSLYLSRQPALATLTCTAFLLRVFLLFTSARARRGRNEIQKEKRNEKAREGKRETLLFFFPSSSSTTVFPNSPLSSSLFSTSLLLLRRQRDPQNARQLRQDRRARDSLARLVLLHDLRLLVDRLREGRLRHPFREPGGHDALLELGGDAEREKGDGGEGGDVCWELRERAREREERATGEKKTQRKKKTPLLPLVRQLLGLPVELGRVLQRARAGLVRAGGELLDRLHGGAGPQRGVDGLGARRVLGRRALLAEDDRVPVLALHGVSV